MFYNLNRNHNQIAVIENFHLEYSDTYQLVSQHNNCYPIYNSLIWTCLNTLDYDSRYGLNNITTYKYKDDSRGIAFIKEWNDIIKISKIRGQFYYNNRFKKTKINLQFIKSIYYIDNIPFVEINLSFKKFLHKVKIYYKNKISSKKHPTNLLKRQIYGHF